MLRKNNAYATLPKGCAFYGCPQVRERDSTLTTGSQRAAGRYAGPHPMIRILLTNDRKMDTPASVLQ